MSETKSPRTYLSCYDEANALAELSGLSILSGYADGVFQLKVFICPHGAENRIGFKDVESALAVCRDYSEAVQFLRGLRLGGWGRRRHAPTGAAQ